MTVRFPQGSVDDHFRLSVAATTIEVKGTTRKSTPVGGATPHDRGLAESKGHDRLMSIVGPTTDTPPPPSCPLCKQGAVRTTVHHADTIITQSSTCAAGHLYQLRWLVADGAA